MKLSNFIDGLNTLRSYYKDQDGFHIGAEHDQFYAYATDKPLSPGDIVKMRRLGWFQPELETNNTSPETDEAFVEEYDPEEGWSAFT